MSLGQNETSLILLHSQLFPRWPGHSPHPNPNPKHWISHAGNQEIICSFLSLLFNPGFYPVYQQVLSLLPLNPKLNLNYLNHLLHTVARVAEIRTWLSLAYHLKGLSDLGENPKFIALAYLTLHDLVLALFCVFMLSQSTSWPLCFFPFLQHSSSFLLRNFAIWFSPPGRLFIPHFRHGKVAFIL